MLKNKVFIQVIPFIFLTFLCAFLGYKVFSLTQQKILLEDHLLNTVNVLQNLDAQRQYMNQMSSLANSLNNCTTDVCSKNIMNKWFELASKRESLDQQLTPLYGDMQVSAEKVQQFLK